MSELFATRDGTALNVDQGGEGKPFVFQHGLCGNAGQTREAFPNGSGYRRITVEARGHGSSQSGPLDRLSIATFADDVAEYIEKHLPAPVVLGGISMGAAISLRLAIKRPELVKALVIARPAWVVHSAPENMQPNGEVGRLLNETSAEQARELFMNGETGRKLSEVAPDNLASLMGFFSRLPLEVTSALLSAIAADGPDVTEDEVRSIQIPALVIGHQRDFIHPLASAKTIAAAIPGARFVEITPKVESRERYVSDFHTAITDFLKDMNHG
ncbi:alpha/beta hydrolase [Rhizobium sp. 16-449-1b]|uniref:alpha/beta fold hydrolase n=1 Tax=Rhizobium sp. 16-449-1b TaxID=2819989 RepID=UPI001ADAEB5C|nr:alpha/beta hydrolase [Rhizobium sp. 16-449-1b]MBO9197512.1 alpha/beta hydrolase [Rhizobium sp. 16-449-1b]